MQLAGPALRARLRAAACVLLAAGTPSAARAQAPADSAAVPGSPRTQLDASGLFYGERGRTRVVEPQLRVARTFANGQSLAAQLGLDVITGASPTGALPTGRMATGVVTTTTPSGNVVTTTPPAPNAIPLAGFRDTRGVLDVDWTAPLGVLTPTLSGHFSRERDYQSAGGSGRLAIDLFRRLSTLTVGGGFEYDDVFPTVVGGSGEGDDGGEREGNDGRLLQASVGLVDAAVPDSARTFVKRVGTGLVGWSQVLSRRWIVGVNLSRTVERGYLTEPYKVVSVMQPDSGTTIAAYKENRPSTRDRRAVLATTVYHFARDVLHASYRWYADDWDVRSHTVDLAYRHDLPDLPGAVWVEPHLRGYRQSAARFYVPGLVLGAPVPEFATADYRLGPLTTATLGLAIGFTVPNTPGQWMLRADYVGQIGRRHPGGVTGVQRDYDLGPRLDIGSLVVGYSVGF